MIYIVGIITIIFSWLGDITGFIPQYTPAWQLGEIEIGFYFIQVILFGIIWFLVWFLTKLFGTPNWFVGLTSRQGTSGFVDVLILLAGITVGIVAIGKHTLSNFLTAMICLAIVAALQSLVAESEAYKKYSARLNKQDDEQILITNPTNASESDDNLIN